MRSVLRHLVFVSLVLLSARGAHAASAAVCSKDAVTEVLILESQPGRYTIGYCDVQGTLGRSHLRALSRSELAQLFVRSREKYRERTAEVFDNLGLPSKALVPKSQDSEIGAEAMVFLEGENRDVIADLAEKLREIKGSTKPVREVTGFKSHEQLQAAMLTDWFSSFEAACRSSGGAWQEKRNIRVMGALALDDDTDLDRAERAQGHVVCKCGSFPFSNPIDYSCRSKESKLSTSVFVKKGEPGSSSPSVRSARTTK